MEVGSIFMDVSLTLEIATYVMKSPKNHGYYQALYVKFIKFWVKKEKKWMMIRNGSHFQLWIVRQEKIYLSFLLLFENGHPLGLGVTGR